MSDAEVATAGVGSFLQRCRFGALWEGRGRRGTSGGSADGDDRGGVGRLRLDAFRDTVLVHCALSSGLTAGGRTWENYQRLNIAARRA